MSDEELAAIRARAKSAHAGWVVSHPWTDADYSIQALLTHDILALLDEIARLRAPGGQK